MVQFGRTLNEVVKSDWKCHAVAYMELKRALSDHGPVAAAAPASLGDAGGSRSKDVVNGRVDQANNEANTTRNDDGDDAHSVHTESSYRISDAQKASFFRIYEDSIRRLTKFYDSKVAWAEEERGALEKVVARRVADDKKCRDNAKASAANTNEGLQQREETKENDPSSSTSFLVHRIGNFSRDLGLSLEFLELNATAFSKIMKKFDKRTGSSLRETKLGELRADHPYLYDGGELRKCKKLCVEWTKELQLILQRDERMVAGRLKGHFSSDARVTSSSLSGSKESCVGLSVEDSLVRVDKDEVSKRKQAKGLDNAIDSENPQESSEMKEDDPAIPMKPSSVRFNPSKSQRQVPRSVPKTKTKDSVILQKMIDKVNEELCFQKADSPFFDRALDLPPPPSFTSAEVELAGALGEGEFCKIYEVKRFDVPEGCHICFLHRGFKDPAPSFHPVPGASNGKASQRKFPGAVVADKCYDCNAEDATTVTTDNKQPTRATRSPTPNFTFPRDDNISDYDDLESDHEEDDAGPGHASRGFMRDHCLRNGEARYAIKRIRSDLAEGEEVTDAAVDLAREAEFLAALKHPNVIRIRGTIGVQGHPKFSLVLDRLYDTLGVQMKKWRADRKRHRGKFKGLIGKNRAMLDKLWMDQMVASYDLSRAMAYLHSRGILHRDIKPANIGFDIRGDIKIFDFGLAKELKPCEQEGEDKYRTDGLAGTRRYMAPEMVQVMPYGLSADVYSFGILLWEILTLKNAFDGYSREKHYKEVIVEGHRPRIPRSYPFVVRNLVERCWHRVPLERPTFQSVCGLIKFGMPNDSAELSSRSDDLLLRSIKSNRGDALAGGHLTDSEHPSEPVLPGRVGSESPPDPLSLSIRVKCPHPSQLKTPSLQGTREKK